MKCFIIIVCIALSITTTLAAGFDAKELVYLPYADHFSGGGIDNFWVDSGNLYILDSQNCRVVSFSIAKGVKNGEYKIPVSLLDPNVDFLVYKDNIFILTLTHKFYWLNIKTNTFVKQLYYNIKDKRMLKHNITLFAGVDNGKLYVSNETDSCMIWDNGRLIQPSNIISEVGQRYQGNISADTYVKQNPRQQYVKMIVNRITKEINLGDIGARLIGANKDGAYLMIGVKSLDVGFVPFNGTTIQDRIVLPQIYGAPLQRSLIFSDNGVYYLMGDKEGLRLFRIERTATKGKNKGFEKYQEKYDFRDHIKR